MKKFLLAAVLLLAACDQSSAQNKSSGVSSSPANPPASIAVGEPHPATPSENACGADQTWVGKKKDDVDMSGFKAVRVIYPNQPVTMDFSPERLNVILEEGTDIITEVKCG